MRILLLLFVLAACAADPQRKICAPISDPIAYANCLIAPVGRN